MKCLRRYVDSFSYLRTVGGELGKSARVTNEVNIRLKKASTVHQMRRRRRRKVFMKYRLSKRSHNTQCFQNMCIACHILGSRDVSSYKGWDEKIEDIPHAML